jgi:hypothetical protein
MGRKLILFLRGAVPLTLVALLLVGLPTLLAWWLLGGPLGWHHLLIGLAGGAILVAVGGLILGWAMGRFARRGR